MGLFDDIGGTIGGVFGAGAGMVGGLPGMIGGGLLGGYAGSQGQRALFGGGAPVIDPYTGMATYPTYVGMEPGEFMGANAPREKFVSESMRNGPSRGTQFALTENAKAAQLAREQAKRGAVGMARNAEANLAMKGGLGAGAKERIQKQAIGIGMDAAQGADANASQARANLLIADEAARGGNLSKAAGLEQGKQAFQYGVRSGELDRRNLYNMNQYNKQMEAWGAGKQAQATENSGKK